MNVESGCGCDSCKILVHTTYIYEILLQYFQLFNCDIPAQKKSCAEMVANLFIYVYLTYTGVLLTSKTRNCTHMYLKILIPMKCKVRTTNILHLLAIFVSSHLQSLNYSSFGSHICFYCHEGFTAIHKYCTFGSHICSLHQQDTFLLYTDIVCMTDR